MFDRFDDLAHAIDLPFAWSVERQAQLRHDIANALRAAAAEEREACANVLNERADEWRRTAKDLADKGAPPELRNHAHDMKDEANRWASRIRARGEVSK